jgi:hypothetical protein
MKILYTKSNTFIFVFLFILAFAVRLVYLLYFKFDGLYGQDAYAYAEYSKQFYYSIIEFKIPPYFYWPIGFYIFSSLFAFITAGYSSLSSLLVSLNAGALTAGFIYLLAKEFLSKYFTEDSAKKYSIAAGFIICFAGITTKQSVVIMSDALGLLFITISALFLIKYINEQTRKYLILCFVVFAFGVLTRYAIGPYIIAVIPVMVYILSNSKDKKQIVLDYFISVLIGFLIFLPQLLYILKFGIPYFQYKGSIPTWASSWSPLNIFSRNFFTVDGTQHYKFINGIFYSSPVFHPLFLSLFGISFIFGLYNALKKLNNIVIIFLLSWIAVYVIYLSGSPFQSIRYTLTFFPPLVILSVFGIAKIKISHKLKKVFIAAGLLLLMGYSFYDFSKFALRKEKEKECVEWVKENITKDSEIFTFEVTGAVKYYNGINAKEFYSYNYNDIKQITDTAGSPVYFFLPVDRIHSQWKDLPIESTLDSLKNRTKLASLGKVNDFEGFKTVK